MVVTVSSGESTRLRSQAHLAAGHKMDLDELKLMKKVAVESVVLQGLGPEDATPMSKVSSGST